VRIRGRVLAFAGPETSHGEASAAVERQSTVAHRFNDRVDDRPLRAEA
jgi:hypothetical protein